jgi:replicative DNA helicase
MSPQNTTDKGLPTNVDAERLVLGSILLDDSLYVQSAGTLEPDDFSLEKHRRIFRRMGELQDRAERIDRITVANELMKHNELESCDGLSYLVSLDDGLPQIPNLESYIRIVKDKAILRRIIFASQHMINRCMAGMEDPADILAGAEDTLLKLGQARAQDGLVDAARIITGYEGGIEAFLDPSKRIRGISTGFSKFDEMTSGLHTGDLFILAGRPSMGKTALALNIAQHVALKNRQAVAIFSLEMSKESLLTRMLCATARVDSQKFRAGYLNQQERVRLSGAVNELVEAPLYIDDTAGVHLMDMHAKLRRVEAERKLGLVVVDYLQLMTAHGRHENRNQEVTALSRGLKLLGKELNVPMLVLSQLSRAVETRQGDHRPQLSDLRESGCLTGDTLIPIPCGGKRVPIRELAGKEGFHVWALNEKTLKLERAVVARALPTGVKPVFELKTRLGRVIRATANHPFRAFGGWKRLDELKTGEHLAVPRSVPGGSTQSMRDCELALLGHLIGDGCALPGHAIQYTTREPELAETVAALAREAFGGEVEPRINAERSWFQVYLASTRRHTHGVHSAVADWLMQLGIFGLRSWEKRVPGAVFEQPPVAIALFLRHLWATDGCIALRKSAHGKTPLLYYATSSKQLAHDVQSLLLRLEVNARVRRIPQGEKGRDQFHVIITGGGDVRRAAERISAVGSRRRALLDSVCQHLDSHPPNTNRDIVPKEVWRDVVVPALQTAGMSSRHLHAAMGTTYCGTSLYRQNLSRDRAERLGEVLGCEAIQALASSDLYWDKIESITAAGVEEVFDLTVPGPHNFIAADFVVHNSIEQDADLVGFVFRPEVYNRNNEELRNRAELILAKQRNGPIGTVQLVFLHEYTKFENPAEDTGPEPE